MRTSLLTITLLMLMVISASAEIMCTERGGCWETGRQIRLIHSRQEISVPSRDGKGTTRIIGIANDIPGQRLQQTTAPRRR
jgi:hypothetical protein